MDVQIPTPSPEELETQRRYAALVYNLRGYLAEPGQALAPNDFAFKPEAVNEGSRVELTGKFNSPPLMAQIHNVQLKVQSVRNTLELTVYLEVPVGTLSGPIRLVWPDKTLCSKNSLTVNQRIPSITILRIKEQQDEWLQVYMPDPPVEVRFGMISIRPNDFQWTKNDQNSAESVLRVHLPQGAQDSQLLVRSEKGDFYQTDCTLPARKLVSMSTTAQKVPK